MHTLLLAGRFDDTFQFKDSKEIVLLRAVADGEVTAVRPSNMNQVYDNSQEVYSTEFQQIWQTTHHTTIAGLLGQWGELHVMNLQTNPETFPELFLDPPAKQDLKLDFERFQAYVYHLWQPVAPLQLIGGVSYDWMKFPENFRSAPLSTQEKTVDQVSPKAGLILTPTTNSTLRFAYTRSLGGASLDQSFRLEPTQVAGINQAFRSIIPESVAGANAGARFETYGLSLEQKFPTSTYLGFFGQILKSNIRRTVGAFDLNTDVSDLFLPSSMGENLDFEERSLYFSLDQLLGAEWCVGARYRLTEARLSDKFPAAANAFTFPPFQANRNLETVLHQLDLHLDFNHSSGFFARFDALWNLQSNSGYQPDEPGDEFWHLNVFAGYRFLHRKAEFRIGVLNLTDRDYRLEPLTLYNELPRGRTLLVRFQFQL